MPHPTRKRVLILYTGGTFGMESDPSGKLRLPKVSASTLAARVKRHVPELKGLADCTVDIVMNLDSCQMGPAEWIQLAERVQSRWHDFDGVVILHGTDTLVYSASALSFLLRPCLKPVVLTGAQRPLSMIRSDARRNLVTAVEVAAHGPRAVTSRVSICFDDRLLSGNRSRKWSAQEFHAFESPQAEPLAVVGTEVRYLTGTWPKMRANPLKMEARFSEKVFMLHLTPGFPAALLDRGLLAKADGIVLVAYPSGTAPTRALGFINFLRSARELGVPVVVATEGVSHARGTEQSTYEASEELSSEGCVWAGTMTPECAYVKTAWILGQLQGSKQFKKLWSTRFSEEN